MSLLYHAYVYLEFLILACTIYILAPQEGTVIQIHVYITIRNDASGGVNDDSKDIFV
jgi:hypothetical protein